MHWTVAHCGAVLQKYRNLYVFSNILARHKHKPFKLAVKNNMRGRCLCHPRVSRRGLMHVLNMETLDMGLQHRAARQRLALGEASSMRRNRPCMSACMLEAQDLNLLESFGALCAKCLGAETFPQRGCKKGVPAHKGCAERVQKGVLAQKGGCTTGAQRVLKGC